MKVIELVICYFIIKVNLWLIFLDFKLFRNVYKNGMLCVGFFYVVWFYVILN